MTCRNDRLLAATRQQKARTDDPKRYAGKQFREFELVHEYDGDGIMIFDLTGKVNMEEFKMAVRYFLCILNILEK